MCTALCVRFAFRGFRRSNIELTQDVEVGVFELISVPVADVALNDLRVGFGQVPVGQRAVAPRSPRVVFRL